MSTVIIVAGLPGSGKTTFSDALSREIKIACLHKDSIKESLYDKLGYSTLEESKRLGCPVVEVLLRLAEEQIENGVDVIIESPFNFTDDYSRFKNWQKKYNIELYSIICTIDQGKRENRFRTRKRHKAHHDHDRNFDLMQDEEIYKKIPGKQIFITTNKPVKELVEVIKRKIDCLNL